MQHPGLIQVEGGVLTSQQFVGSLDTTSYLFYVTWWLEFFPSFPAAKLSLGIVFRWNFSPVSGCVFLPGLKIWMAFLFFIGYLFLKQLHTCLSCNYMRILVLIGCLLFLLQLYMHTGFPACRIKGSHDILQ